MCVCTDEDSYEYRLNYCTVPLHLLLVHFQCRTWTASTLPSQSVKWRLTGGCPSTTSSWQSRPIVPQMKTRYWRSCAREQAGIPLIACSRSPSMWIGLFRNSTISLARLLARGGQWVDERSSTILHFLLTFHSIFTCYRILLFLPYFCCSIQRTHLCMHTPAHSSINSLIIKII